MSGRLAMLTNWISARTRRQLSTALIISLGVHIGLAVYLLRTHPFIPFKPVCYEDYGVIDIDPFGPYHTLDGEMTREFYLAVREQFSINEFSHSFGDHGDILVTLTDWFEEYPLYKLTLNAAERVIELREKRPFEEIPKSRYVGEDGLYELYYCRVMRGIVLEPDLSTPKLNRQDEN